MSFTPDKKNYQMRKLQTFKMVQFFDPPCIWRND